MNANQHRIDRRTLLKGGGALGLSTLLSSALLSACGSDDDGDEGGLPAGAREALHLNFDLSASAVADPRLHVARSKHDGSALKRHDAASRARHRQLNSMLSAVPDDNLTHYLEDVDLPADALQLVAVRGVDPATGGPVLASHFLHVPKAALAAVEKKRSARGQSPRGLSRKLHAVGGTLGAAQDAPISAQIAYNTPVWDLAVWMVFQHPSITNLNAELGADIIDRITNLPCTGPNDDTCDAYVDTLASTLSTMIGAGGFPSTDTVKSAKSWAILQQYVDPLTGIAAVDDSGAPIYSFVMNEALDDTVAAVVRQILNDITNDPAFAGTNYRQLNETPGATAALAATPVARAAAVAATGSGFQLNSDFHINKTVNGLKIESIQSTDQRDVSVTVRNYYLRTHGVYVEYLDGAGNSLPVANKGGIDTDTAKFLGAVMSDSSIMGIPVMDDTLNPPTTLEFTMPDNAVSARVHFGSLGLGGAEPFSDIPKMGAISTLVMDMALPTFFLVGGIATAWQKDIKTTFQTAWQSAIKDPKFVATIVQAIVVGGVKTGVQASSNGLSVKPFIAAMTKLAVSLFTQIIPKCTDFLAVVAAFSSAEVESTAEKAVPIVGQVMWALSTIGDVAAIAESLAEVLANPALKTYTLSFTLPTTVRVSHDPDDSQFPATATHYTVSANYGSGATPAVTKGTINTGTVGPIDVPIQVDIGNGVLRDPASGGTVTIDIEFYSSQGCVVGRATTNPVDNKPGADGTLLIPVTIKELLVSLDSTTTYQHKRKTVYQGGRRTWSDTAPVPQLTRANLCQGTDAAICNLRGVTVHTATGMLGYGFYAGGQGVDLCTGGSASTSSVNTIENLSIATDAESGLKFSSCGSTQPIGIVYGSRSEIVGGHNFFLQLGSDSYYHLRGLDLDGSNFNMAQTKSWGRFHSALDSLTVTDNGVVVGINRSTSKIEALGLPSNARDSDNNLDSATANFAVISSGKGSAAGHLDTPVAVSSFGNTVLILEQGNNRVQAFDTDGNTVSVFKDDKGAATPLMPLQTSGNESVIYLDIAAEARGYVYVLSCIGGGQTPSQYRLDLYTPDGRFLTRTTNFAASKITVDLFRNVYALNYESMAGSPRVEPTLSNWLPYSTGACPTPPATAMGRARSLFAQCRPSFLGGRRAA